MACRSEEELRCPVCHEVFKDPVILSCSHSFCKLCLKRWWNEKRLKQCPVCRRPPRGEPLCNLALKNLCESFVKDRSLDSAEDQCSVHSEKLKLFCLDHQQPVCVVCRDSKAHRDHSFSPIEEAAQDLKEELQKSLQPLKNNLQKCKELKKGSDKSAGLIKDQTRLTEKQIQDQFKKLHQFLLEEEEVRMKALREEEEQKTQRMKDKMEAVNREIAALSETIADTEEQLRAADVSFLLKYKAAVERVQHCPLLEELQQDQGALIDQAKHLGNLVFNIWSNMKRLVQYTPVVLDPNTAHPALILSDDLTSFTSRETQQLPLNPESVPEDLEIVLGSKGFTSGSHSWDVNVADSEDWVLGVRVMQTLIPDDDDDGEEEWWAIKCSHGKYEAINQDENKSIHKITSNPRRIRVQLNCNNPNVTFSDADTNTSIHSFKIPSTISNQEKFFPFFGTKRKFPIAIVPQLSCLI